MRNKMVKYRKLNGVETLKEGDEFLNYDCETWLSVTETMIGKMLNQTEIVVARRTVEQEKQLTAVNWLNHNPPSHSCSNDGNLSHYWSKNQVKESFNSGHKNGRLERDIDYKPFFDAFSRFRRSEGIILKDLCEILENIQPLGD